MKINQGAGRLKLGDQLGYNLYIPTLNSPLSGSGTEKSLPTITPTPRHLANIEAEQGETLLGDFDQDGISEHFKVGGKRHSAGGTPLQVPEGSFVFSDTPKLKLGGPILAEFGKSPVTRKKFTPATLAKQYDINKFKSVMEDPDSDPLDRQTADLMINNNSRKLGKLALVQEALKGFPTGIPGISFPILAESSTPVMRQGGPVDPEDPVDPYKGDKNDPRAHQRQKHQLTRGFNKYRAPWLKNFGFDDSPSGLDKAILAAGYQGDLKNSKEVQQFLIRENLQRGNQGLFKNLLDSYGMTNQGLTKGYGETPENLQYDADSLDKIFADGKFGVRSGMMLQPLLDKTFDPSPFTIKPLPYQIEKPNVKGLVPHIPIRQSPGSGPAPVKKPVDDPMPWWTQDKINAGAALVNRFNIRKDLPTYITSGVTLPDPTFFDPTRQLAANQDQAAQQNMMAAMFAGPQRLRSVGSDIQGQASSNAANILSQVENRNVGVANQFEQMRPQILNVKSRMDADARKEYLDGITIANQQYDNSVREAGDVVRSNVINGITNSQKTYWLNQLTPQYKVDPTTGRISFTKGKDIKDVNPGSSDSNPLDTYKLYYDQFMSKMADPQKAHEFAQKMAFNTRSRFEANSDGETNMTSITNGMNPMALQLLGMYAPQFLPR